MRVFVANFGQTNWAWEECRQRSSIAIMDDVRVNPFWRAGDLDGYRNACQQFLKGTNGQPVTQGTSTGWFNLLTTFTTSVGDVWLHSDRQYLWFTKSLQGEADVYETADPAPLQPNARILVYHKLCEPWANKDSKGAPILWAGLHPRAQKFLIETSTASALSQDNSEYIIRRIAGEELDEWHERKEMA